MDAAAPRDAVEPLDENPPAEAGVRVDAGAPSLDSGVSTEGGSGCDCRALPMATPDPLGAFGAFLLLGFALSLRRRSDRLALEGVSDPLLGEGTSRPGK